MRAPFQILAIPYKILNGIPHYCVLHRADCDQWQFVAGGGEDNETPEEACKREIFEETSITVSSVLPLKSMCFIPTSVYKQEHLANWANDTYVVPEYAFAFNCNKSDEIVLSHEHEQCVWLAFKEAREKLKWDSNKTALYELNCKLTNFKTK